MIDKLSKLKDLLNHKSFNLVVNEIESQIKDNHYDLIVNEDNFECTFDRLKNNNKEITKYIVSFNDNELIFNTYLAIVDNDNNVINSSFLETYNEYGIQITKEYKLYSNKIKTEDYFKRCIEGNNYNYIESIKRQYFDTADIYIENKIENNIYKSKILLKGNNGYQKMEYDLNGYKSQIIPSITKDNIQKLIDLETDDVIKKGLLMLSENRENYEYKSTEDPDYLSKGFAYKPNKSKSMLTKTMIIPIILFVCIISIVYAAYTGILNINGTGINRKSNFSVHFANLSDPVIEGDVQVIKSLKLDNNSTIIDDFNVKLITPGDYIEYTFDVVNDGDYAVKLTEMNVGPVKCSVNGNEEDQSALNLKDYIKYRLDDYDTNTQLALNTVIESKSSKKLKLKLLYSSQIPADKLPTSNVDVSNLGINLVFESVDGKASTNNDGSTPKNIEYAVGDRVSVGGDKYYVIGVESNYYILFKEEPLTVSEVNKYGGVGTDRNRVNQYYTSDTTGQLYQQATDLSGYGGMSYYDSETCNAQAISDAIDNNVENPYENCYSHYQSSQIKYVVNAWADDKFDSGELVVDSKGYTARLITKEELENLGYDEISEDITIGQFGDVSNVPKWVYSDLRFWTMSNI